ncbi:MAG: fibro-slime domain-containing protein, partial [Candidatus Omnitrophica bacterium]|nr:fibro-slime domain-containing protein [Candidatus Omnitrophota bacterium]
HKVIVDECPKIIDDDLVIDLGGVHSAETASVDLDTLGLTPGNDYGFDLFFAERHTSASNFRIDTSLLLVDEPPTSAVPEPASLLLMGSGLLFARRRLQKSNS